MEDLDFNKWNLYFSHIPGYIMIVSNDFCNKFPTG